MKNDENKHDRLVPLSAMKDYKIAKDNPDVLGWRVVGADGESLGIVRDLIVDTKAMKARYLSVVADRRFFNTDNDQYLLVPIGVAALDKSGRKVFLSSIDANTVSRYPVYQGGPIPEEYEYAVRDTFSRSQRAALEGTDDYKHDFDEALNGRRDNQRHISDDFYNTDTYNEERFYTSNQEVHRDKKYPSREHDRSESVADLNSEERRPRTVEESIATIERLEDMRERGSITEEEFILLKKRALNL